MANPRIFGCNTNGLGNARAPSLDPLKNANWYGGMQSFGKTVGLYPNSTCLYPCVGEMRSWPANLDAMLQGITATEGTFVPVVMMKLVSTGVLPENYKFHDAAAFADVAKGRWDSVFAQCVSSLARNGFPYAILAPSYNFNVTYIPSSLGFDVNTQSGWQAAFGRVSTVVKNEAAADGIRVDIAWCPTVAYASPNILKLLPDMTKVDILALNVSNAFQGPGDYTLPQVRINYWNNGGGGWGMLNHITFASNIGKPVFFPEVRSGFPVPNGPNQGTLNDTAFFNWVGTTIKNMRAQNVRFLGMNILDLNNPGGNFAFTDGSQPVSLSQVSANLSTFVGDQS